MTSFNGRQPIGIFDSGVGGLTVMKQLITLLPSEPIIYFGDTARVPYGDKNCETIVRYSMENAQFLMQHRIKLLIIACNTAAAFSAPKLRSSFTIPIVDVIEAGVSQAIKATKKQRIAILATRATIESEVHKRAILSQLPQAFVFAVPCPLFVPIVEEHFIDHPAARLIVKEYLKPIKRQQIDTLLLGCTHYPLLAHLIRKELSSDITIVDSSQACAQNALEKLQCTIDNDRGATHCEPHFYVSDDPDKFQRLAENFFGRTVSNVERVISKELL